MCYSSQNLRLYLTGLCKSGNGFYYKQSNGNITKIPFYNFQCFCFEEQRLNPQEEVDMPVFFYIDPEFAEDPKMVNVDFITLSYTFFEAKEGHMPVPGYNSS